MPPNDETVTVPLGHESVRVAVNSSSSFLLLPTLHLSRDLKKAREAGMIQMRKISTLPFAIRHNKGQVVEPPDIYIMADGGRSSSLRQLQGISTGTRSAQAGGKT